MYLDERQRIAVMADDFELSENEFYEADGAWGPMLNDESLRESDDDMDNEYDMAGYSDECVTLKEDELEALEAESREEERRVTFDNEKTEL